MLRESRNHKQHSVVPLEEVVQEYKVRVRRWEFSWGGEEVRETGEREMVSFPSRDPRALLS